MRPESLQNLLLGTIAGALLLLAIRPYAAPPRVEAQAAAPAFYVEPGVQMLRMPNAGGQVLGKVFVDLRSGQVWGFPTYTRDPFPSSPQMTSNDKAVSHPFPMGRFALSETEK